MGTQSSRQQRMKDRMLFDFRSKAAGFNRFEALLRKIHNMAENLHHKQWG